MNLYLVISHNTLFSLSVAGTKNLKKFHDWLRPGAANTIVVRVIDSILFIGGAAVNKRASIQSLNRSDIAVAAADSGYDSAVELGFSPQLICGDMDSLSDPGRIQSMRNVEVAQFDRDKDETDTELGLRLLSERGYTNTLLCGGGASGRFDHELGVLWTFFRKAPPRAWLQPESEMVHIRVGERLSFTLKPGTVLSCFPASCSNRFFFESRGLRWPLEGLDWRGDTVGISNEVVSQTVSFAAHEGSLLVVRPDSVDEKPNGDSILEALWKV